MNRHIVRVVVALGLCGMLIAGNLNAGRADQVAVAENNALAILLNEAVDMQAFQTPMSLKESLGLLMAHFAGKGKDLPILVDQGAFKEENPEGAGIYDTQVSFQPFPKKMRLATVLELILSKVDPPNATFVIRSGLIVVTTKKMASPRNLLQRTVLARFHHTPLSEAIDELSAITGATIVVDNRVGDKLKTPISASLKNDLSLEAALHMLSDMADLKMVALPSGIYITEPANADRMRMELGERRSTGEKSVKKDPAKGEKR